MVELIMQRLRHHFPMKNGDRINLQALAKSLKSGGIESKLPEDYSGASNIYITHHGMLICMSHYGACIITSRKFFGREDTIEDFVQELWRTQIKKFIIKKKAKGRNFD